MNPTLSFREHRLHGLWWLVDREFEAGLGQIGMSQKGVANTWLELGRPGLRSGPATGRGPTAVLEVPGRPERLHLRRTLHGGLLAPLWRGHLAGVKRVRREIEVTAELFKLGAPVPRPVVALGIRSGLFWRASLATVHLDETQTALQWLASRPDPEARVRGALATGAAVGRFHACGGRHADLHAGNILVRIQPNETRAWVIDLDKARIGTNSAARQHAELRRLAHSLEKRGLLAELDRNSRDAFIQAYREALQSK